MILPVTPNPMPSLPSLKFEEVMALALSTPWKITTCIGGKAKSSTFDPYEWSPSSLCQDGGEHAVAYFDSQTHRMLYASELASAPGEMQRLQKRYEKDPARFWQLPSRDGYDTRSDAVSFVEKEVQGEERQQLLDALHGRRPLRTFRDSASSDALMGWEAYEETANELLLVNFFREHGVQPVSASGAAADDE